MKNENLHHMYGRKKGKRQKREQNIHKCRNIKYISKRNTRNAKFRYAPMAIWISVVRLELPFYVFANIQTWFFAYFLFKSCRKNVCFRERTKRDKIGKTQKKFDLLQKIFLVKSIKNKFNVKINIDIAGLYRTWKFEYLFWKL